MAPAKPGDGIIAGGPMRAVFEVMGVTDIVCRWAFNPYNLVRATLDALKNAGAQQIAGKRRADDEVLRWTGAWRTSSPLRAR